MKAKHWTENRLVEPSTHTAVAVFLLAIGMLFEVSTMETIPWTPYVFGWAAFHGFLGIILKEGRGL